MVSLDNESKIKDEAMKLDNALEKMNIENIIPFFTNDCVIHLLNVKLDGKEGVRKWLKWLFNHIKTIKFEPIIIIVENEIFFEEFIVKAELYDGRQLISKQAEVLIYENFLIKELRLYFDRLDFADAVAKNPISKSIVKRLIKKSLKGLE